MRAEADIGYLTRRHCIIVTWSCVSLHDWQRETAQTSAAFMWNACGACAYLALICYGDRLRLRAKQQGAEGVSQGRPGVLGSGRLPVHIGYVDCGQAGSHHCVEGYRCSPPEVAGWEAVAHGHAFPQAADHCCKCGGSRLPWCMVPAPMQSRLPIMTNPLSWEQCTA